MATQGIMAQDPHQEGDGLEHQHEHQAKDHMAVDPAEGMAQGHPAPVGPGQGPGPGKAQHQGGSADPKGPHPEGMAVQSRQQPAQQNGKDQANQETELP